MSSTETNYFKLFNKEKLNLINLEERVTVVLGFPFQLRVF